MRKTNTIVEGARKFKFGAMGGSGRRRPFVDSMSSIFMGESLHSRVRTLADMDAAERAALERIYGMPIAPGV